MKTAKKLIALLICCFFVNMQLKAQCANTHFDGALEGSDWTVQGAENGLINGCGNEDLYVYVALKGATNNYLLSPAINLESCKIIAVSYALRAGSDSCKTHKLEEGDKLIVEYTADSGTTWKTLHTHNGKDVKSHYQKHQYLINPVPTATQYFFLRFRVITNKNQDEDTWLIDDVRISDKGDAILENNTKHALKVAFMATAENTQKVVHNKEVKILFEQIEYDYTQSFTNSEFTVPEDGLYHFDAHVRWNGFKQPNNYMWIGLFKNDTLQKATTAASSNNDFGTMISSNLLLKQNDKISIKVRQSSGSAQNTFGLLKNTWFSGYKIY
jgi:hypothetical protein